MTSIVEDAQEVLQLLNALEAEPRHPNRHELSLYDAVRSLCAKIKAENSSNPQSQLIPDKPLF